MNDFEVVCRAQIDGDFEGFDDEVLFKLNNGTYWVQSQYKYWYYYAYCPEVLILRRHGVYYLQVVGQNEIVPVAQISDVIESRINGDFNGWEGETSYQLTNGQVWQQSAYKYTYKYSHMPSVVIFNPGSGYVMQVAGTSTKVRRIQ
ncbi:hypothetical protein [Photobacterium chitinilyticum]|uniref:Uncharacterized protein n=1 Tax=Photobacterium chitinilyticum TaxID=2485123 RepID=A0A3S3QLH9_9GAMM|nr:hypothetical protein [Photobacterium chitinilyticum]RWX52792.1 hypothetical protein EDI28_25405 [Photobacterium chitinilyticum]